MKIKDTNIGVTFLGKWSFVSHRNTSVFKGCFNNPRIMDLILETETYNPRIMEN